MKILKLEKSVLISPDLMVTRKTFEKNTKSKQFSNLKITIWPLTD